MPVPTVPHPTPTTSPEPKPTAPRKGKAGSKDMPTTELSSSTDSKNINPLDLKREIEILAAGVCGTRSQSPNVKNMGLKASKYAKSSGSENSILSNAANTEKRKTRKSKRSKRSIKARTLSPTPAPQLMLRKSRKTTNVIDDDGAK